jgi:hypothetical protein
MTEVSANSSAMRPVRATASHPGARGAAGSPSRDSIRVEATNDTPTSPQNARSTSEINTSPWSQNHCQACNVHEPKNTAAVAATTRHSMAALRRRMNTGKYTSFCMKSFQWMLIRLHRSL